MFFVYKLQLKKEKHKNKLEFRKTVKSFLYILTKCITIVIFYRLKYINDFYTYIYFIPFV